ncbi:HET-domain-containing protein [Ceratocystis lukuohia]|uniref:HET-domain-containing protein n=1 Tax=Ceratocystis lukuohia TaxID=2019550 RepID=A0ABR4MMB2_9PEZI
MRLLHTLTLRLSEFPQSSIPEYAILSHVRDSDEPSLHSIVSDTAHTHHGYRKILGACRQAQQDGYEWIWIDTVCIDQTSPSEVSEAVNSVYLWYEEAAVCYVYLADVPRFYFGDSQWFERGWTLIELIAPRDVEFYAADWTEIGTKNSLETELCHITGIRAEVLRGTASPATCSVAERLSWAARRCTTKLEDEAYCLMGLFGINMPVVYGEGRKAWTRLQELILQSTEDLSLLAWSPNIYSSADDAKVAENYSGCLSPGPFSFGRPDLATFLPSTTFGFDDTDSIMYPDVTALEWRHVQRHVSRSSSSKSSQFAYDSPVINNRGIELTLLVDPSAAETSAGDSETVDDAIETEVLAWLYTDVVISGNLSPIPMSDSSSTMARRTMMVCVWMTVYRPSRSWSGKLWARRTPGKSPVAVPLMSRARFQPKKMFLQRSANKPQSTSSWKTSESCDSLSFVDESIFLSDATRSLNIRMMSDMDTTPLRIVSHYPASAKLKHPQPAKSLDGCLANIPVTDFRAMTDTGRQVNASGALKFFLMGSDPAEDAQFVVIFGQREDSGNVFCHVEQTDMPQDAGERPFRRAWSPDLKGGSISGVAAGVHDELTDRSMLLLDCGTAVVAMVKKRRDGRFGKYVPTLVVACHKDGRKFFDAAGRESECSMD